VVNVQAPTTDIVDRKFRGDRWHEGG